MADVRRAQRDSGDQGRHDAEREDRAPAPPNAAATACRRSARRSSTARTRTAGPTQITTIAARRPEGVPPVAVVERDTSAGEDRDDEEAPVDRRVLEHRVDPVERRVRVSDDHLRVPEDVAGRVLVDRRSRRTPPPSPELRVQEVSQRRLQARRASESAISPNGSQKNSSATAPSCRSSVHSEREAGPGDERRQRPRQRPSSRVRRVAADELQAEQQRRADDDGVAAGEQVRVGRRRRAPGSAPATQASAATAISHGQRRNSSAIATAPIAPTTAAAA